MFSRHTGKVYPRAGSEWRAAAILLHLSFSIARRFVVTLLLPAVFGTSALRAQVITGTQTTWTPTATGSWGTGTNWSTGSAPTAAHTAIFTSASAKTGTITMPAASVKGIVWQAGAGAYTLSKTSGGSVVLSLGADGLQNYSANLQTITGSSLGVTLAASTFFDVGSSGGLTISTTGSSTALGANTLTLKGSSTGIGTISSAITGTGAIVKDGSGTWTLSGSTANTFTGVTTVNGGTLQLSKSLNVNALAGSLTIGDGVGAASSAVARWMQSAQMAATTAVTLKADGWLDLNNFNQSIGTLTLTGGNVTTGTGTLTLGNTVTTNADASSALISGNVALGANRTFSVADGAAAVDLDISAVVSGAFTVTKNGTGMMVLSGTNSYTGATTVSAGVLNIQNGLALGTTAVGTTVSSGSTLQLQGGIAVGTETLSITGAGAAGQTGALINASGTNSYGGLVTLAAASTISSDSGTLNLTNTGTITGAGRRLTLGGAGDGRVSSIIGNTTGGLTKTGTGTWTLAGTNTFTGTTVISGGTLIAAGASANGALRATTAITVNSGGTLLLGANNQINNAATMTLAGGTFSKGDFAEGSTSAAGVGALTLTAAGSRLDFGNGTAGILAFASFTPNSQLLVIDNWTGTANTVGSIATDRLIFNSSQSSNLGSFSFSGYSGVVQFDLGGGFYEIAPMTPVPEPATYAAGLLALVTLGFQQRHRLARAARVMSTGS